MLAADLLSENFPYLTPEDPLSKAVDIFMDTCVCHLAVVKDGTLEGILPTDLLSHTADTTKQIRSFKDDYITAFAYREQHGLDVFELISKLSLSAIPVVDEQRKYLGSVITSELLNRLSNYYSFKQIGGIVVLRIGYRDYNLAEINHIVSGNNAKILMLYLHNDDENEQYILTLKLDTLNIAPIIATFERYKYAIDFYQPAGLEKDELHDRYELLMKLFDL